MTDNQSFLLELSKYGLGKENLDLQSIPSSVNWKELYDLALMHGIDAIVLDGINRLYREGVEVGIDFDTKMQWIGNVKQMEVAYHQNEEVMHNLAAFYLKHGIRMMVLKGYGVSLNYPIPDHRHNGDIDIYLFGEQKRGDELLHKELGIKIDKSHHHHTVFDFQGETVENHYDFINIYTRKSNKPIEKRLKELALKGYKECADNVYLPSADFNAIFLLRHCSLHFASTEMTIRQILDWGFFMEKHHKEISWNEYIPFLKNEGMYRFYNLMGLFCVEYLRFDASIFNGVYKDELFERFANEVMSPEFKDHEDGTLLHSLWVKPRRWWHNRWKNRICYSDTIWEDFVYGLWAKILKPSHFIQ